MMVNIGESGSNPPVNRPSSISGIENDGGNSGLNSYESGAAGSSSIMNGQDSQRKNDERRVPYTMPGVLHFLQHEWSRIELERTHWEMERAELKARISFLQGERKGQENLKRDLVRRIKMLEYSLKQERLKIYRLTHNGEDPENLEDDDKPEIISDVPLDVDAVANNAEAPIWKRARHSLKQYLEELGYSDGIVNVRAFRSAKLMGNTGSGANDSAELDSDASKKALDDTEREILDTADFLRKYNLRGHESDNPGDDYDSENRLLDDDAEKVMDEFSFLDQEKEKTSTTKKNPQSSSKPATGASSNDEWRIDEKTFNRMRERFRIEQQQKRQSSLNQSSDKSSSEDSGLDQQHKDDTHFDENQFSGNEDVDIKDDFAMNEDDSSLSVRWNLKYTLRSHYDAVRAIQFHPVEPVLITASEDGTAKLWNLNDSKLTDANKAQANNLSGIVDIEPVYTFRGHDSAILSIDMSPTGDNLYTGSLDGTICCWQVPSVNIDIHDTFDSTVLQARFTGHSDAVWSVNYQSSTNRLISASSDTTIKIWDLSTLDENEYLIKTIDCNGAIPQSIDIVSTEPQQLLVAYSNKKAAILDIESGGIVLNFEFPPNEDIGDIFKILSHPTMPVTILAGSDRKIRYFDNHTGRQIYGAVAHMEAISTLAIDPNGLYLMSGSHDGSLRIWNMEQKKCLQEIAAHRKKSDMSVLSVAFHPSRPLIGAAGADSLAKIFSSQRIIEGLSTTATTNEEESA
jgi:striatin 1/3/4